jgi:uncharacterized repeat protein (TIGR03843 family)
MATEVAAERVAELLAHGEISPVGLLPGASNDTFLCTITDGDIETYAVYKPRDGEAPLWDFPDGTLYRREMAAYVVARAIGWDFVPPTVIRDGPMGVGMVQLFIEHDPGEHYLTLEPGHREVFRRVAAFDLMINNADRKSGHCLLQRETGRIFVVDHGVTFHAHPKLRTVIWDYAGEHVPADLLADAERFLTALQGGEVRAALEELLDADEIGALQARTSGLVGHGTFPEPGPGRPYPWPPI